MLQLYKIPESVLVIIYTIDLKVLLIERTDYTGYWQSITGSKNTINEPLYITACREITEETGIIVNNITNSLFYTLQNWNFSSVYEIYSIWRYRYAPGVIYNTEHVFSLLVPNNIVIKLELREHRNYQWLSYHKAAAQCFSPSNSKAILQLPYYNKLHYLNY